MKEMLSSIWNAPAEDIIAYLNDVFMRAGIVILIIIVSMVVTYFIWNWWQFRNIDKKSRK